MNLYRKASVALYMSRIYSVKDPSYVMAFKEFILPWILAGGPSCRFATTRNTMMDVDHTMMECDVHTTEQVIVDGRASIA
jgi:hypothetical protein